MLRLLKICMLAVCLLAGIRSVRAFSLGGPLGGAHANGGETWETTEIGYNLPGDIVAPHNLGEEYRWNMPVLYYSFDQNYLDYFGSNGVVEVDKAFAILNNSFTNNPNGVNIGLDGYSSDLSEFPDSSKEVNFTAQALQLWDIKSTVLELMVEQLGLASPERYVWTLHDRLPGPLCPVTTSYVVVKRNFDPVTFQPSSYVNDTLYSYTILEFCSGPPPLAVTAPFAVDPLATVDTSVASMSSTLGEYYTGLTKDDIGGLRYLLRTNNMNIETAGPGTTVFTLTTNSQQSVLHTLDLTMFLDLLPHTDPATLLTLYPGLDITSVQTNLFITNSTVTFLFITNYPWLPAGTFAVVFGSQSSLYFATNYTYTFGNIVTNHFFTNWPTIFKTNEISVKPFSDPNFPVLQTNSVKSTTRRGPGGDFYILPDGISGYVFVPGLVITNKGSTNIVDPNLISVNPNLVRQQVTTYFFTNYQYVVYAIQLTPSANGTNTFQGIEKMSFVRRDFDSLISQFFQPITNTYTLNSISGSAVVPLIVRRVVTAPDILFTAQDLADNPGNNTLGSSLAARSIIFEPHPLNGLAGPGNIRPQMTVVLNKVGPLVENFYPFLDEVGASLPLFLWGSFDGTTNAPVVYPDGSSIMNVENQVLMQITTTSLPDGTNGIPYNGGGFQLVGSGGSPPYDWEIVGNALPPGLTLSTDGLISGTPTSAATYDFTIRMTDIGARSVQRDFTITIHP